MPRCHRGPVHCRRAGAYCRPAGVPGALSQASQDAGQGWARGVLTGFSTRAGNWSGADRGSGSNRVARAVVAGGAGHNAPTPNVSARRPPSTGGSTCFVDARVKRRLPSRRACHVVLLSYPAGPGGKSALGEHAERGQNRSPSPSTGGRESPLDGKPSPRSGNCHTGGPHIFGGGSIRC